MHQDIDNIRIRVDTVIQNPPFGVKLKHADKVFLEKAMMISDVIYTIHKANTIDFISKIASSNDFIVDNITELNLPLKQTMPFHVKKQHKVKIALLRLKRNI